MGIDNKRYKKLLVWQEANKFALDVYKATSNFPKSEIYGMVSQLRRAALSVPTNIVEGQPCSTQKGFLNFLYIANRSLAESEFLLEFCVEIGYLKEKEYQKLESQRSKVGYLLYSLMRKLNCNH